MRSSCPIPFTDLSFLYDVTSILCLRGISLTDVGSRCRICTAPAEKMRTSNFRGAAYSSDRLAASVCSDHLFSGGSIVVEKVRSVAKKTIANMETALKDTCRFQVDKKGSGCAESGKQTDMTVVISVCKMLCVATCSHRLVFGLQMRTEKGYLGSPSPIRGIPIPSCAVLHCAFC